MPQSGKPPSGPGDDPASSFQKELTGPLTLPQGLSPCCLLSYAPTPRADRPGLSKYWDTQPASSTGCSTLAGCGNTSGALKILLPGSHCRKSASLACCLNIRVVEATQVIPRNSQSRERKSFTNTATDQALCWMFHTHHFISSSQQSCEVGEVIPILEIRKLRAQRG